MKSLTTNYDYFLFDLDDTLYPEIEYLKGAYKRIAKFLSNKTNIKHEVISSFLINRFENEGRELLFDSMFDYFKIDFKYLTNILEIMRTYTPDSKLSLYPNIYEKLPLILKEATQVFVVTNGNVIQQKNKVRNIDWKLLDEKITFIYANEYKKKPSVDSFNVIKREFTIQENSTIMIGDSHFDKKYAENCKIDFMFVEKFNAIIN